MCKDSGFVPYYVGDIFYARECQCGKIKRRRMNATLSFAEIPPIFSGLTMADFDAKWYSEEYRDNFIKIKKVLRNYINKYFSIEPGKGLYLFSNKKGTGKTRAASILANELIRKDIDVKFTTSGKILDEIKKSWGYESEYTESKLIDDLTHVDVLIIDDFGVEKANDWRNEKFYNLINERYMMKRTTIFTSNYSIEDLEQNGYDSRIISRIKESCYIVPFIFDSVRDAKEKNNQQELKSWLKGENNND